MGRFLRSLIQILLKHQHIVLINLSESLLIQYELPTLVHFYFRCLATYSLLKQKESQHSRYECLFCTNLSRCHPCFSKSGTLKANLVLKTPDQYAAALLNLQLRNQIHDLSRKSTTNVIKRKHHTAS